MSYLHTPRLVFSGDFLSDVSTINNDPAHYNNDTFIDQYQLPGKGATNGWWNPEGGAIFNFQDCQVFKMTYLDGSHVSDEEELIGLVVKGADGRATGKMVDIDPQQQGCSELWSLRLRILNKRNELILEGSIETTAFRDLQYRQTTGRNVNGQPLGGTWNSVLTDIEWGEITSKHKFFSELMNTTEDDKLSINLNGFGYYYNHAPNGRYSLGKILGAIGPWFKNEPDTFTAARRLYGIYQNNSNSPAVYFSNSNFLFERKEARLTMDLGACFPIVDALGTISFDQNLIAGISHDPLSYPISTEKVYIDPADFTSLGPIHYKTGNKWLQSTSGIVSIDNLAEKKCKLLEDHQVILLTKNNDGKYQIRARVY